jgi:PEP-CTERM motif
MNERISPSHKNLKLALLAGTCLTSVANAATVIESMDFGNTVSAALGSPLPVGTDMVSGTVNFTTDLADFLAFTNLVPGSPFSMEFTGGGLTFNMFDSVAARVGSGGLSTSPAIITGSVPSNGILVAYIGNVEGSSYTANLTATTIPEPHAVTLAGLGVAAAALRRTRRAKKSL